MKTIVVDVPAVLVTVKDVMNDPPLSYVWEVVGTVVVAVFPSPKSHA